MDVLNNEFFNLAPYFPPYLVSLIEFIVAYFPFLLVLGVLTFIPIQLAKIVIKLREKYTFLEVRPTYNALETAFSTKQLFTILHALERDVSLIDRILGVKQTMSCELVSTKNEGIRYILRVVVNDVSVIQKNLRAHLPGIEIKEIDDYLPDDLHKMSSTYWRLHEYKLRKPFAIPLQEQSQLQLYDPIAYITTHMTTLKEHEMVALQIVCAPISAITHSGISDHIHKLRTLLQKDIDISDELNYGTSTLPIKVIKRTAQIVLGVILMLLLLPFELITWLGSKDTAVSLPFWIFDSAQKKPIHRLSASKQYLHTIVEKKISEPLFEISLRVFVAGNTKESAKERMKGIQSSLGTFATAYQSFKRKYAPSIRFLSYFLLKKRLSALTANPVLSISELSSIYHLPYTETTKTEDLQKVRSPKLAAPLAFKKSDITFDTVFAHNTYGETSTAIGLTLEERRRHMYIIGATGTGKTTLLLQMIYEDIKNGKGVAVIDPHGDLSERLLEVIPQERIQDVIYFNPYDVEYPVGLNVLELPQSLRESDLHREKDLIASSLISIFHKLYPARYSGPRMEHVLRNTVLTALELEDPTLFSLYKLLTNVDFRKKAVEKLNDEILKDFWKNEFEKLGSYQKAEVISPITNKLGRFLTAKMTRNILNQTKSKIDFEDIMNNKKILLCDLSKGKIGEDTSSFLGSLLIAKLQLAVFRRVLTPQDERKDFFLYIDEFQNFATLMFAQILSEARKYRLNTVLAHQTISQIEDKDLLKVILANVGTVISFRTSNPSDEDVILPLFTPQVKKNEIANLPSYCFYIKVNALSPQDAFTGTTNNFSVPADKQKRDTIIDHSRNTYGKKIEPPSLKEAPIAELEMQKPKVKTRKPVIKPEKKRKSI